MRKQSAVFVLLMPVIMVLAGCATSYGPGFSGFFSKDGYFDEVHANDRYTAVFTAIPGVPAEDIADMVVMRAAELSLMHGYDYFRIDSLDVRRVGLFETEGYGAAYGGKYLAKCSVTALSDHNSSEEGAIHAYSLFQRLAEKHGVDRPPMSDTSQINRN